MKAWIRAARLKTLPLAVSGILLSSAIAYLHNQFEITRFLLGILTGLFLQILSNYANDYGDYSKGTDQAAGRTDRALASGAISKEAMRSAIIFLVIATLGSGISLLLTATENINTAFSIMLFLGIASILAAITYTIGIGAYGYRGLGDVFVFIFFGIVSVVGMTYLYLGYIPMIAWPAAAGIGFLATGVLTVNNIRDIESDKKSGKHTIPVRLGFKRSMLYHRCLIWLGLLWIIVSFLWHLYLSSYKVFWLEYFLIIAVFSPAILVVRSHQHRMEILQPTNRDGYNRELKSLSLSVLLVVIIYWIIAFFFNV